jgi:hypothetical protein
MLNALAESLYDRAVGTLTAVFIPDGRVYWAYLLTALVIAVCVAGWYLSREGMRGKKLVGGIWSNIFDTGFLLQCYVLLDYCFLFFF